MIPSHFLRSVSLNISGDSLPDKYPFNIPGIRKLRSLEFHPRVTFFVGDNGMGKSTLLEALAIAAELPSCAPPRANFVWRRRGWELPPTRRATPAGTPRRR